MTELLVAGWGLLAVVVNVTVGRLARRRPLAGRARRAVVPVVVPAARTAPDGVS